MHKGTNTVNSSNQIKPSKSERKVYVTRVDLIILFIDFYYFWILIHTHYRPLWSGAQRAFDNVSIKKIPWSSLVFFSRSAMYIHCHCVLCLLWLQKTRFGIILCSSIQSYHFVDLINVIFLPPLRRFELPIYFLCLMLKTSSSSKTS